MHSDPDYFAVFEMQVNQSNSLGEVKEAAVNFIPKHIRDMPDDKLRTKIVKRLTRIFAKTYLDTPSNVLRLYQWHGRKHLEWRHP